ncbi:putative dehydrogenase [Sinobaca qinghaiensis]|uniref:Putative dehydrogenase n=1 Tax=Sinobaca qinghaiensis TaxID=342944 RepID=A0A419V4K9_9BACL|nr:Gfo/Idh/MocA family oxidoreductase [Sinobaca qinghaiensis]RKD73382.1 putative dehydrogenase [Sinobaca qinghaiensis]
MKIATIGTNWITEAFIEAGKEVEGFELQAVFSRDQEKAEAFASKNGAAKAYNSLEAMFADPEVEAVYIASPNRYHAEQALAAMDKGKHVICEKPLCSNEKEADALIKKAEQMQVVLMEGIKNMYTPAFKEITSHLEKAGPIRRVYLQYCQYSSRYDAYKEGTVLNAFKPELSNGSSMDLGVYLFHPAIAWFGRPSRIMAMGYKLETGVDGQACVLMQYEGFEVIISYSKIMGSSLASEIQGEDGVLRIDNVNTPEEVAFLPRGGKEEKLSMPSGRPAMSYEIEEFIHLIKSGGERHVTLQQSRDVLSVIDEVRQQLGVVYEAD